MAGAYEVRRMQAHEVSLAIQWAKEQGWNPGLHDAACFYQADPDGFFIGELDGIPIATGCAVVYGDAFAFCGLYIVKEEFRSSGYGMQLTQERLKYAGNRITGLDGVLSMVDKYKRLGYVEAHRNIRFAYEGNHSFPLEKQIVDLRAIPFAQLLAFDRACFPEFRPRFLTGWISQPEGISLGYVEGMMLKGYAVARKCAEGWKIGPLFAETLSVAMQLFESIAARAVERPIFLDCPEPNRQALELVSHYGMQPMFEVIRMYRNGSPNLHLKHIYGITTFELG